MNEFLQPHILLELAVLLASGIAAYSRLAANLERTRDELKEHITEAEREREEIRRDYVQATVYELQISHLNEKLTEISENVKELKRLIILPLPVRAILP